jgi:DNA-binding transcriptional LysR family regulator
VLARFHKAHPAVRLELATGTTAALAARVLRGELDAAFIAEPFSARNLEAEPAFVEELVLITPRGHPRVTTAKDLREATILAFASGCAYRRRLEAWLGRSSMVAERVMEYGSYHAIVACAAAGSGIAVVPRSVLRASGMEAQLAVHPLPAKIANARTVLVRRRGYQSAALDALRKALR